MSAVETARKCSRCGASLPTDAPEGLCPRCLIALNLATQTDVPGEAGPHGTKIIKPPLSPPDIAKYFPQLEILECLGRGGMGVVYKARQPRLDRVVALKILAPEKENDAHFAERFTREAQALARLSHANIVTVHDFGEADGLYYLVMEFVDGANLRQLIQSRQIVPEEALAIVPKICEALQYAHDQGIVHRDIKPENVLVDKQGRVKIADFGIAKIIDANGKVALTEAQVVGTPHYMAPEQIEQPTKVDHRADIYSLGVVFYEMLTGELPLGKFQPPSKKVEVDVRLDEVVLHALEKEPSRRYQHASEVKTDVETIAGTPESSSRRAEAHAARDSVWFSTQVLPELLPGERIVHSRRRLWAVLSKSWPTCRLFFSLPPLWSAGLYITNRRIVLAAHFLGLAQNFSIWFRGKAPDAQREVLNEVLTGQSPLFGPFLQLRSEDFQKRWWRSRELRMRLYLRQPETLRERLLEAQRVATEPSSLRRTAPEPITQKVFTGVGAAWAWAILFSLLSAAVVVGWFASDKSFSLLACLGAVFALTIVVRLFGAWILLALRRSLAQPVSASHKLSGIAPMERERIRREVKGPAIGLVATGILNWLAIPLIVFVVLGIIRGESARHTLLPLVPVAAFLLSSLMIAAGLKMKRLEAYGLSIGGSILAMIVTPGSIIGLPLGIWALVVLSRREVREAFARQKASPSSGGFFSIVVALAVILSSLTVAAHLPAQFLVPVIVLCLLAITAAKLKVVGRPVQAPRGSGMSTDAKIVIAAALLIASGLLTAGWIHKNRSMAAGAAERVLAQLDAQQLADKQQAPRNSRDSTDAGSPRRFVRLVVDSDRMTFEGQPTTWNDVGALLASVPERKSTVLEFAVTSDQITVAQQNEGFQKASALARQYGFEYASFVGVHPLGSKGTSTTAARVSDPTAPQMSQLPPVVISTLPPSGASDVDPALTELRVTFSKQMQDAKWSLVKLDHESFPETAGEPRFLDERRTCVLPVRLKPGKVYAMWINSESAHEFKDSNGQPAVPYLLIFETQK